MENLGLFGLFLICTLASSLYPLGSEAFVIAFLAFDYMWFWVWIVATLGNTLGALSTYAIGYAGDSLYLKYFKNTHQKIHRYANKIQKRGSLYAFLSFLPILGDVFALALGVYRYPVLKTIVFITLGKGMRYLILIYLYHQYTQIF
nr:YqaA family protein [Helicobacter mesocricetorum]